MQLTPFAKFLVVAVIMAGLVFGYKRASDLGYLGKIGDAKTTTASNDAGTKDGEKDSQKPTNTHSGDEEKSDNSNKNDNSSRSSFNFSPEEPVNGVLKGVVELGASGFNAFMVRIDKDKNWKLEKAEFGSSLVAEGMANGKDVKETLKNYIGEIANFGVAAKNIHFVVSSGAAKSDKIPPIVKALKQMGYVVNTVDPSQEGKLALSCSLPASYFNSAFSVDIGSGNTKISWVNGNDLASAKSVETHGAKYYEKGATADQVFTDVQAAAAQVPKDKRDVCFIIGGAPHKMAEPLRNGKERYTVLNAPDATKTEGEKEKAGVNIYKAIAKKTGCSTFVFDWHANFTIGFLLSLK